MRTWCASAVDRYYFDPMIEFLQTGTLDIQGLVASGYYIVPHCSPDCCQAFGGVTTNDLGPFSTRVKARAWSRKHLVEPGERVD
jgi:hypothetical protein